MPREPLIRSRLWAWLALGYLALVYALLPVARPLWRRIEPLIAEHQSTWFLGAGVVVLAALGVSAWNAGPRRRAAGVALLLAVLVTYVLLLVVVYRGRVAIEKIHLLEYGILGYLTLNAVNVTPRGGVGLALAVVFLAAAGLGDEALQRLLPERYFDWLDIFGNWGGSALGAAAWLGASSASPWRRPSESRPPS